MNNPGMTDLLSDYYAALERLKKRKAPINNDAVAIEAGRKKGTIKKSRPIYRDLIAAIAEAAREAQESTPKDALADRLQKTTAQAKELRRQLDASRARELSLLYEVLDLKKKLAQVTGEKIVPMRRTPAPKPLGG